MRERRVNRDLRGGGARLEVRLRSRLDRWVRGHIRQANGRSLLRLRIPQEDRNLQHAGKLAWLASCAPRGYVSSCAPRPYIPVSLQASETAQVERVGEVRHEYQSLVMPIILSLEHAKGVQFNLAVHSQDQHDRDHRRLRSAKRFCNASNASSSLSFPPPPPPFAFAAGAGGTGGGAAPVAAADKFVRTMVALSAFDGSTGGVTGITVSKGGMECVLVGVARGAAPVFDAAGCGHNVSREAGIDRCTRERHTSLSAGAFGSGKPSGRQSTEYCGRRRLSLYLPAIAKRGRTAFAISNRYRSTRSWGGVWMTSFDVICEPKRINLKCLTRRRCCTKRTRSGTMSSSLSMQATAKSRPPLLINISRRMCISLSSVLCRI